MGKGRAKLTKNSKADPAKQLDQTAPIHIAGLGFILGLFILGFDFIPT
jgi:hypothetical protein